MAQSADISVGRRLLEICIPYHRLKRVGLVRENQDNTTLRRALPSWQIIMIAIGGVIGITIFSTHGEILRLAGPGGLLVATLFVIITMVCVMECIGELVILWPVPNAMVEYVRAFVDEDLAIVIGIAYWYSMSCVFATLIVIAAAFAEYTISSDAGRYICFYAVIPFGLILINALGVEYYGFIEGIGGFVKLAMVASGILFMVTKAPKAGHENFDDSFYYQRGAASSNFEAICVAIPLIAYGYIGTEIVSVTAFEAIDRKSLRFPARTVSYIIGALYFLSALLQCFLVNHNDKDLQSIEVSHATLTKRATSSPPNFYAIIVIAAERNGAHTAGRYFNGCIIYFCISAANTALYVSSRTLFGLCRGLNRDASVSRVLRPLRHFGMTTPTRQVPIFALIFSAVAFYWLVPLQLRKGFGVSDMLAVMSTTASIGGFLVWASQCIVFIRYYNWLRKFRNLNRQDQVILPPRYNRWEPRPDLYEWHANRMFLSDLKLVPAVAGLIGCFLIVFVFSTANWWVDGNVTIKKLATAYAGPIVLSAIFICLKMWNRRWWVVLDVDTDKLAKVTTNLERSSNLSQSRESQVVRPSGDVELATYTVAPAK